MNIVSINGKVIKSSGNICINNGKIFVGWDLIEVEEKDITIVVQWDNTEISADSCNSIIVEGSSGSIKTMSGNVKVAEWVTGCVSTMSWNVKCGSVGWSVTTMSGSISSNSK